MQFNNKYEWALSLKPGGTTLFHLNNNTISLVLPRGIFLPHPDSLLLADYIRIKKGETVCDLGTGSGILAITAAKLGATRVYGSDVNKTAIKSAKLNAFINSVEQKCRFKKGNWFEPFGKRTFDAIIANPPQIPARGKDEQKHFRIATEAGRDGTVHTAKILRLSNGRLKKGGRLYLVLKEWMDWKKVIAELKRYYKVRKLAETFSPVWTKERKRLLQVERNVKSGKSRYYLRGAKKYYRIYAFECTPRHPKSP